MADLVAEFPQFRGELAQAFAGPTQRRHRIATRRRFDQRIEVVKKLRFYLNKRLAAAARALNATFFERRRQVLQTPADRTRRTSRNTRDGGNPAIARGLRFARRKKDADLVRLDAATSSHCAPAQNLHQSSGDDTSFPA